MTESTKEHCAHFYAEQLHGWTDLPTHKKITWVIKKAMLCVAPRGELWGLKKFTDNCRPWNAVLGTRLTNFCLQFHLIFSQGKFVNKGKELSWCCWERVALLVHAVLVHHHDVETVMGDPQQQPAKQGTRFVKGQHQPPEPEQRRVGMVTGATQSPLGFSINREPDKEQVPACAAGSALGECQGNCTQLCSLPLSTAVTRLKKG